MLRGGRTSSLPNSLPLPSVGPSLALVSLCHSVHLQHVSAVNRGTVGSLTAAAHPTLQPRPVGSRSDAAQPRSSFRPAHSSRRAAAAPSTRRPPPRDVAAPFPQATRSAYGAQPQLLPGFSPYPVTPPVQRRRARRGRRSGIGSAAGASSSRHFVFEGPDGPRHRNGGRLPYLLTATDSPGSKGHKDC
ncbi:hypothetical protein NDU88_003355 [Pleurodeles waltl]|uniref:Uncharacterized protein n=1 Tax=Pleurodeles waltl TaxID=8319 RepID=A0AAV7UY78_PLEWA|nr:hypothetical protein NDU88_003355 [Pleurodeles waltl]